MRGTFRRRAQQAAPGLTLKSGANVLLLDEPTNDIDVNTLRALEEGLENFAGCAVIISHDRWFLDRITTHMLAFEGDSRWCGLKAITRNTRKITKDVLQTQRRSELNIKSWSK